MSIGCCIKHALAGLALIIFSVAHAKTMPQLKNEAQLTQTKQKITGDKLAKKQSESTHQVTKQTPDGAHKTPANTSKILTDARKNKTDKPSKQEVKNTTAIKSAKISNPSTSNKSTQPNIKAHEKQSALSAKTDIKVEPIKPIITVNDPHINTTPIVTNLTDSTNKSPPVVATLKSTTPNNHSQAVDAIYKINQRFAQVPVKFCPIVSNGYGFEVRYPSPLQSSSELQSTPVITKVYGRAFLAGLKENARLLSINHQSVRTQRDFNSIIFDGKPAQAANLLPKIQMVVSIDGIEQEININKGDYCLSNLTLESEQNILRLDLKTSGSGYSTKAETTAFVDPDFLEHLTATDQLTLASVAAAEQYRHALKIKRGRTGMIFGQVIGTLVTFTTGIPITEVTTSSSTALGMQEDGEGALRPAASYGYYLGLDAGEMHASLEKLAAFKEGFKAQGKRYDWQVRGDLTEFDQAAQEMRDLVEKGDKEAMLKPKLFAHKKDSNIAVDATNKPPVVEVETGVGSY